MDEMQRRREMMVRCQLADRGIDDPAILAAFRNVPRHRFVSEDLREDAYDDGPLPIGEGQTISQPFIVAQMIAAARIGPGSHVLEIGAGSGYAAAILARLAASVIAIERHEALATEAKRRIDALGLRNCTMLAGDGMAGRLAAAPFDAILVAARDAEVPERQKDVADLQIVEGR
ncbi:methyltransferase domain-containing protein [Altererythrobacter aurantiacus]|uniref:Protein-L-isoaspartate O-methyltransferase n=1 Tax=Parapontixanthobacter aurantiacus TaxID=1463599 RepID=A0A844ZH39_9SPHN|nr:methyltransferase domain-containing protein [Parapontixanthobacter aurantiacus]MXO87098.1 methyltransferase domain-containing protein [Parapontixanthobacter aurantiacus]